MIDHALASGLPEGTLSSMTSAYRLVTFLQGVLVVPMTTIMFSRMSKRVAQQDERGALELLTTSTLQLACVVLPIVAIGIALSRDVSKFAYMRGRFTLEDAFRTAGVLSFYLVGIPAFGMRDFLSRMFHALQDTKTPFRVSLIVVATNIVGNVILRRFMGANGLALATSIAGYVGMVTLILLLRRRFGHIGLGRIFSELSRILAATALCAAVAMTMDRLAPPAIGTLRVFVRLAVCTGVSLISYAIMCIILRVKTVRETIRGLRRG